MAKTPRSRGKTARGRGKVSKVPTNKVAFRSRARGSAWQPILDQMKELLRGETLIIGLSDFPSGTTPRQVQNRLTAAQARFGPRKPSGRGRIRFRKRTTEDGDVAISVEAISAVRL